MGVLTTGATFSIFFAATFSGVFFNGSFNFLDSLGGEIADFLFIGFEGPFAGLREIKSQKEILLGDVLPSDRRGLGKDRRLPGRGRGSVECLWSLWRVASLELLGWLGGLLGGHDRLGDWRSRSDFQFGHLNNSNCFEELYSIP